MGSLAFSGEAALAREAYRPDVDGLRALAVLAIFAFHLGLAGSPGGFVGVDVFFVISGFVITRGVLLEIDEQRFSLKDFYLRRARRILPALIVTLLATLLVGAIVLSPSETREFAGSALASLVSAANVFFHDRTNYFADAAHYRPLLHTWSLSLEEQFYLLFPLFLGVLVIRAGRAPAHVLGWLVVASLAWCVVAGSFRARHAFYMPMARFWELGAGALIACVEAHRVKVPHPTLMGLVGLGGIAASVALLDGPETPTWMMLGPVAAAAAVILSGGAGEGPVHGLLSARTMVAIGRLSYAIYLLHWPAIVFWRMCVARPLNGVEQVVILVGILLAAQLLWRFVEKPFRAGSGLPNAAAMTAIGVGCLAVIGLGLLLRADRVSLWRLSPPALQSVSQLRSASQSRPPCRKDATWLGDAPVGARACRWPPALGEGSDLVIWGDSHAGALAPELAHALLRSGDLNSALLISMPHCPPLKGVSLLGPKVDDDCKSFVTAALAAIAKHRPKVVVVAGRWANFSSEVRSPGDGGEAGRIVDADTGQAISLAEALRRTLDQLAPHVPHVVLLGPVPELEYNAPATLVRALRGLSDLPPVWHRDFERRQRLVLAALADVAAAGHALVLYPHTVLCDGATCAVADGVRPLYSDDDHLSAFGAERVARALAPRLLKSLGFPVGASGSP
jgi:peptidoglycan/LPS O-acetylase OafA/YrhL